MRRRFAWLLVAEAAFIVAAGDLTDLRAGTPLSTLRQAVAPARPSIPATLPVVTPVSESAGPMVPPADRGVPASTGPVPTFPVPFTTEPVVMAAQPQPRLMPPAPLARVAPPASGTPLAPVISARPEPTKIEPLPADVKGEAAPSDEDPTYRKPLSAIGVNVAPTEGELPPNAAAEVYGAQEIVPRAEHDTLFFWQATNLCHRPLYFEQNYLERDGRSFGPVQPVVSGVQFFAGVPLLPLRMVRQPPCRCIYTLGESRPDGYGKRH
jgi:hypothetical protein